MRLSAQNSTAETIALLEKNVILPRMEIDGINTRQLKTSQDLICMHINLTLWKVVSIPVMHWWEKEKDIAIS